MQRLFSGYPPRYIQLLRLTLAAALLRLVPFAPYFVVYFVPLGPWFKLLLLLCPVLWLLFVCPARVRYAQVVSAFAADGGAPLAPRDLLRGDQTWRTVCRGRLRRMRWYAMPLAVLLCFLLALLWFADAFTAVKILLNAFSWIAGPAGSVIILAAALAISLFLFGWGALRTGAYRFGYTDRPGAKRMGPLIKSNLRLWLPTLLMLFAFILLAHGELGLMLANFISAAPAFTVKLQIPQIILLTLAAVSYLLLLPLRRLNTAVWAER